MNDKAEKPPIEIKWKEPVIKRCLRCNNFAQVQDGLHAICFKCLREE